MEQQMQQPKQGAAGLPVSSLVGTAPVDASSWLAAIVENSSDAILSKTLDGIITSWNAGAVRLFGYTQEEAIGSPIVMLIPQDRLHEEDEILAKLRRGERVEHFETVRRTRDGRLVEVELSISPVCDTEGRVIGASKIARDVSERRALAARQAILLREMNHRIKNLFSIMQALVGVSRRSASDVTEFARDLCARLIALDAAHSLILPRDGVSDHHDTAKLDDVLEAVLAPYIDSANIEMRLCATPIGSRALTSLALMFHELATNAVKYGALSRPEARLEISAAERDGRVDLVWVEHDVSQPADEQEGFGTALQRSALAGLDGTLHRAWTQYGLEIRMSFPLDRLAQ